MDFTWTDEQAQLGDSLAAVLLDTLGPATGGAVETDHGPAWQALKALGVSALTVPEPAGGLGEGAVGLSRVLRESGRQLLRTPLLAGAMATAGLVAAELDETGLLASVAAGERTLTVAIGDGAPPKVDVRAKDGWHLTGLLPTVPCPDLADAVLVLADAVDGPALLLVDMTAARMVPNRFVLLDGTPVADLALHDTPAELVARGNGAAAAAMAMRRIGIAAACADAVGNLETAVELTRDYLKVRRQFGRTLAQQQVLRHALADMTVSLELCRSMALLAAASVDDVAGGDVDAELARAKLVIGRHGRAICEAAIQLHGAIGMTEEYKAGHCLRRHMVFDAIFGSPDEQARALARSGARLSAIGGDRPYGGTAADE